MQYKIWTDIPNDIPKLVLSALILPYLILWEVTITKSGPGVITAKKWMIINDKNCSIINIKLNVYRGPESNRHGRIRSEGF